MGTITGSTIKLNGSQNTNQYLNPGGTFNYDIASQYLSNSIPGITTIKLSMEKGTTQGNTLPQNSEYTEIKTLYQATHDFMANGNFHYSGVYTPQPIHTAGWYRLKLEVTAPNGLSPSYQLLCQVRKSQMFYGVYSKFLDLYHSHSQAFMISKSWVYSKFPKGNIFDDLQRS